MPTNFSLWVVYQPIKSVISEKFALEAFLLPVFVLYQSHVGLVTWAKPKAVEGLEPGIMPNIFFLSGLANCLNEDSWLIIASCKAIGVFQVSYDFFVALYQFFFWSKIHGFG